MVTWTPVRSLKLLAPAFQAGGTALAALWTFPSMLLSAFLVAWGAEAAQFLISQGLALAILAWVQTLPEFAVEAVIAWDAGADAARMHLAIANLTGAIRLLLGLGWPMIYVVFATWGRRRGGPRLPALRLDPEHAIEIVGLAPPLLYFVVIVWKQTIGWVDALILVLLYLAYLAVLLRNPPHALEQLSEAPRISQWAYRQPGWRRFAAVGGLFAAGGALLYYTAQPFLESMLAVAGLLGINQFVLVQWVAPFLSEFPEKVSAFLWARRVTHAPMALMNMVSSNINQWTVLAAMIPLIYGYSHYHHTGTWADFQFDTAQRLELVLTLLQTALGLVVLADMKFEWSDAAGLFVLWAVQFFVPHLRVAVSIAYAAWIVVLLVWYAVRGERLLVARHFRGALAKKRSAESA
jgi:cation:H+ antiporter